MRTETYELAAELQRVESRLDDIADEIADLEDGNPLIDRRAKEGQRLERQRVGLAWALHPDEREDRDPYESVTISELTASTHLQAGSRAESDTADLDLPNGTDTRRLYRVASAVESGDFLDDDAGFDETLVAVGQLKPHLFAWLEDRVDELSSPDVEGNSFAERVAAARSEKPNDSPSPE